LAAPGAASFVFRLYLGGATLPEVVSARPDMAKQVDELSVSRESVESDSARRNYHTAGAFIR